MAQPTLLTQPFATNGDKNNIPNTTAVQGAFSQDKGFPAECSLPLGAGGVAPSRQDFNGAFNMLSSIIYYAQKGYTWHWDAGQEYFSGCVVVDDTNGQIYECISDVAAGSGTPSTDATHWRVFLSDRFNQYLPLAGGTMIGEDVIIDKDTSSGRLYLGATTPTNNAGASIALCGGNYPIAGYEGMFEFKAGTSSQYKLLQGFPDGRFKWDNKEIKDMAFPSATKIAISVSPSTGGSYVSTQFTAPANGYIVVNCICNVTMPQDATRLYIGVDASRNIISVPAYSIGTAVIGALMLRRGETCNISLGGMYCDSAYFTYAEGEV